MGSFNGYQVLDINTASFAFGSVTVVASEVEVIVGEASEALRAKNLDRLSRVESGIAYPSVQDCFVLTP